MWTEQVTAAFLALKQAMVTTPVLRLPDFSLPFAIETDACVLGVGAVSLQEDHRVAFLSKALSPKHQQLSIYEKELLALFLAVEKWRSYLQRSEFLFKTDHQSLTFLSE